MRGTVCAQVKCKNDRASTMWTVTADLKAANSFLQVHAITLAGRFSQFYSVLLSGNCTLTTICLLLYSTPYIY